MNDEARFATTGPLTVEALVDITVPAEPHLSTDGKRIVYVQAVGEVRHVFVLALDGGSPLRVTAGTKSSASPRWSPDGELLAYVQGTSLVVAASDGALRRTVVEHSAGLTMPRWSPDGSQLAFYSRRRGWSQIWMAPAAGGEARRLTAAAEDNDDLQWSPDGMRIAYSSIRGEDLNSRDIYSVDVATGVEERLTSAQGCFDGAPAWSPDGATIAFLSDADGWVHVYLMDSDGGHRRQLTRGPFEDGWPNLARGALLWSPDSRRLAFVRNRNAMLDLMVVDIASADVERFSSEDGFYQPFAWTVDGKGLVCTASRPDSPPDLCEISQGHGIQHLTNSLAGGVRRSDFLLPQRITFQSRDGLSISALLYKPRGMQAGDRCPAIVHPHGGPTSQSYYSWPDPMVQIFAQEGYAVLEPDVRGSSGYGRAFRLANVGDWGRGDARDCLDSATYLREQEWVDGERIGIWGGSYGGYLALCCLVLDPSVFRAAIDLYGDSDIAESYWHGDRTGRLDLLRQMGSPDLEPDAYRAGSPVYAVERIEAPLLILHGNDDQRVPPLMSERMAEALKIEGKYFEHKFYEGEGHGFRRSSTRRDAYSRMLRFFENHLKGTK